MSLVKVNIRDIAYKPGEIRQLERKETLGETWGEGLAKVESGETIDLDLTLESVHEGILVTAAGDTVMRAECGRCLEEFQEGLRVEFVELFAYNPTEAEEYGLSLIHI